MQELDCLSDHNSRGLRVSRAEISRIAAAGPRSRRAASAGAKVALVTFYDRARYGLRHASARQRRRAELFGSSNLIAAL